MSGWAAALLTLTVTLFCHALGQSPFSVTQDVYQAEERSNITLTWLFPVKTETSSVSLHIDVMYVTDFRRIFYYDSETEVELYPHEGFTGRVRCDLELAKKGQIECLFTDLRLNDTGTYKCIFVFNTSTFYKACDLNVTAASDHPTKETSKPASRGRIGLYVGLGLFTPAALYFFTRVVTDAPALQRRRLHRQGNE